jgi:hypothetical protein
MKHYLLSFLLCITGTLTWAHPAIRILPPGTNIAEYNARNNTAYTQRNAMSQNTISSASNMHSLQNQHSIQTIVLLNNRMLHDARLNTVARLLEFKTPSHGSNAPIRDTPAPLGKFKSLVLPQAIKSNTQGLLFVKAEPLLSRPFTQ